MAHYPLWSVDAVYYATIISTRWKKKITFHLPVPRVGQLCTVIIGSVIHVTCYSKYHHHLLYLRNYGLQSCYYSTPLTLTQWNFPLALKSHNSATCMWELLPSYICCCSIIMPWCKWAEGGLMQHNYADRGSITFKAIITVCDCENDFHSTSIDLA